MAAARLKAAMVGSSGSAASCCGEELESHQIQMEIELGMILRDKWKVPDFCRTHHFFFITLSASVHCPFFRGFL
jgi:hypothetical protein